MTTTLDVDPARLNGLASAAAGRPVVVEIDPALPYLGRADWSDTHACYRVTLHPALFGHQQELLASTFFHEVSHCLHAHPADGSNLLRPLFARIEAAGGPGWTGTPEVRRRHEMEATIGAQVMMQTWGRVYSVIDVACGRQIFPETKGMKLWRP